MNPFQQALLDSMEKEFDYVPAEDDLALPHITVKKSRSRILYRVLAVAVITALLIGATYATYTTVNFDLKGKVDSHIFYTPDGRIEGNRFELSFSDYIMNEDAPDEIEIFMAPTFLANKDTLSLPGSHLWDEDDCWDPHFSDDKGLDGKIQSTWLDYYPNQERNIVFRQRTLTSMVEKGTLAYYFEGISDGAIPSCETFTIGNHEIFDFMVDYSKVPRYEGKTEKITHIWFWTDGDYLYELNAHVSTETMREIFESVQPVEDIYAYLETEKP